MDSILQTYTRACVSFQLNGLLNGQASNAWTHSVSHTPPTDGAGESEAASDEVQVNKAFPPLYSATLMAFETF